MLILATPSNTISPYPYYMAFYVGDLLFRFLFTNEEKENCWYAWNDCMTMTEREARWAEFVEEIEFRLTIFTELPPSRFSLGHTPAHRASQIDGELEVLISNLESKQLAVLSGSLVDQPSELRMPDENAEIKAVHSKVVFLKEVHQRITGRREIGASESITVDPIQHGMVV